MSRRRWWWRRRRRLGGFFVRKLYHIQPMFRRSRRCLTSEFQKPDNLNSSLFFIFPSLFLFLIFLILLCNPHCRCYSCHLSRHHPAIMVIFSLWNSFIEMAAVTSYFIDLLVNKEPFEGKTEGRDWIKKKGEEISFCPEERSS